jgi:hypothetical protein
LIEPCPSGAASSRTRFGKELFGGEIWPMDYADSTLVVLAEELGTNQVLTIDRRDFGVYRIRDRRRFEILPPYRESGYTQSHC